LVQKGIFNFALKINQSPEIAIGIYADEIPFFTWRL